ncbi:hypothetical protein GWC94_08585 [Sediminibacterium sp. WSJ-3]|nr:hypothetical protein [Sediminibacterium soli]
MDEVKAEGNKSVRKFTKQFAGVDLDAFQVSRQEKEGVSGKINERLKASIQQAEKNIYKFHEAQRELKIEVETMPGER